MSNAVSWAVFLSALALAGGLLISAPALLSLRRNSPAHGMAALLVLPASLLVWWCAFLGGFGHSSPFNTVELFVVAIGYVVAIYALASIRLDQASAVRSLFAVCLALVVLIRLLTPEVGE